VSHFDDLGDRLLVTYDGHCGLCNRTVRWLLRHDRRDRMRFVPSVSPLVASLLARLGVDPAQAATGTETILVVRHPEDPRESVLVRSDAVLALLAQLPQPWLALATLLRMVPRAIRDAGYRIIARWRYRIWGRLESCPVPASNDRARFL
jgi:predicted DCC family thiol-disulfide oxidoreductase YuxK